MYASILYICGQTKCYSMKKTSIIALILFNMISCSREHPKEYLTIAGKLENNKQRTISILNRTGKVIKNISIKVNGAFKDTLKVSEPAIFTFQTDRTNRTLIYLKNGFDLFIKGDSEKFTTSVEYTGIGASNSNFIKAQLEKNRKIGDPTRLLSLEKEAFIAEINGLKKGYDSILSSYKDIENSLAEMVRSQNKQLCEYLENNYASSVKFKKGAPSPAFENYIAVNGGKKSLSSYKGKYVYIDVWATWCGPCIREIRPLKNLEKEYHEKNIAFVSISIDESRRNGGSWEATETKWRNFIKDKQMSGIQLWAGKDQSFQQEYQITGIPRFILIDPQGNIVDANAKRPSDPELKTLFNSLKI